MGTGFLVALGHIIQAPLLRMLRELRLAVGSTSTDLWYPLELPPNAHGPPVAVPMLVSRTMDSTRLVPPRACGAFSTVLVRAAPILDLLAVTLAAICALPVVACVLEVARLPEDKLCPWIWTVV